LLAVAGMLSGSGAVFAADEGNKGFIYLNNKICPISGEAVGQMGPAVEVEHNGTKVNLCCKMCKKDFDKDPEGYIKKLQEAASSDEAAAK
jgi:YHS domain-containing protein